MEGKDNMHDEKTQEERIEKLEADVKMLAILIGTIAKQNIELVDIIDAILTRVESLECDPNA